MTAKERKGLDAVRANLDGIFSPEGLKNIELLRKGTLSSLPPESFNEPAQATATQPPTDLHSDLHSDLPTVATTVHTQPRTVATTVRTSARTTEPHSEVHTQPHTDIHTNLHTKLPPLPAQGRAGLTAIQVKVFDFLAANNPCRLSYKDMGEALGISPFTIRDAVYTFRDRGWLRTEKWRTGVKSGVQTTLRISRLPEEKTIILPGQSPLPEPTSEGTSEWTSIRISEGTSEQSSIRETIVSAPPLLDRKIENLSISLSAERIALTWPRLTAAGFGPAQLTQISQALAELGKPTDKIVQSLDHAEWELENDLMRDKAGSPVSDPCSWVFRSLARTGYYRKPKGYISPEEQALIDAEETARALLERRQSAEKVQFEAWKSELTPESMATAMNGYVGGPKDQWLKNYWIKNR